MTIQQLTKNKVEENQGNETQKPKSKTKSKPKPQHDADTKLSRAEVKELAGKIPNLRNELTKEVLKEKKTHIKVNDEIIHLKDSTSTVIEVI